MKKAGWFILLQDEFLWRDLHVSENFVIFWPAKQAPMLDNDSVAYRGVGVLTQTSIEELKSCTFYSPCLFFGNLSFWPVYLIPNPLGQHKMMKRGASNGIRASFSTKWLAVGQPKPSISSTTARPWARDFPLLGFKEPRNENLSPLVLLLPFSLFSITMLRREIIFDFSPSILGWILNFVFSWFQLVQARRKLLHFLRLLGCQIFHLL